MSVCSFGGPLGSEIELSPRRRALFLNLSFFVVRFLCGCLITELRGSFGHFGVILDSCWVIWELSWAHLGLSCGYLGPSCVHVGAVLALLSARARGDRARARGNWAILGLDWAISWPSWRYLGPSRHPEAFGRLPGQWPCAASAAPWAQKLSSRLDAVHFF